MNNVDLSDEIVHKICNNFRFCLTRLGDAEIQIIKGRVTDQLKSKVVNYWKLNDEWLTIQTMLKDILNYSLIYSENDFTQNAVCAIITCNIRVVIL